MRLIFAGRPLANACGICARRSGARKRAAYEANARRVNHLADVKNAVLGWGAHVEVLAPAELRTEVIAALDSARARYRD